MIVLVIVIVTGRRKVYHGARVVTGTSPVGEVDRQTDVPNNQNLISQWFMRVEHRALHRK